MEISYDLSGSTSTAYVTMLASSDSGTSFAVPVASLSGDVGANISLGRNKKILWNAGADWNNQLSNTVKFRVTASDTSPGVNFLDDFDDNVIDTTRWATSGYSVIESGQIMQVLCAWPYDHLDQWGILTSKPISINSSSPITISRKVNLHYANSYFGANTYLNFGNLSVVAIRYYNMVYNAPPNYIPMNGFYICRNGANPHNPNYQGYNSSDVSSRITPLWDTWFKETIVYNPQSGNLAYSINDVLQTTFNVGVMPAAGSPSLVLTFDPGGWWQGHQHLIDDLIVSQAP